MAENKLTREIYLNYAKKIVSVLYGDEFFNQYKKRVENGYADFKLVKKRLIQDISIDWISTIEQVLPNLDTIVRNPRKFIVQEEDIVDISLCKAISTESVKHLAQHTNMISKVDPDGTVTPSRILNITKEESFEIYENRFIYTLLLKLKDFVQIRYDKIKKASATQDVLQLNVDSKFNLPSKKVTYRTEYMAQLSFDEVLRMDAETLDKIERIAKIDKIITDFLSSSFAKAMRNSAPVRPPITRTNVILKEPNFKKALTLWQFIETYQATGGFSTSDDIEDIKVETESQQQLRQMVTLNTMLFESLYDQHETDMDLDDAQFTDLLRVGDLDFAKDEIQHDEYAQKLEEDLKEEAEKEEESEEPPETPPEEPEIEIEEEEVIEEVEVEKEVDKDVTVETPPKEEPEDEEPDADKFDQNLFDVRKLYKRPEEDKLRQEEISRIKDAIDRCLMSYRKIKQEELDQREREEALRRRTEELERRAEAFRQRKQELEKEQGQVYLGNDAFSKADVKVKDDFKKAHQELFVNKNEKLSLTDDDLDNIRKSIEIMDHERAKEEAKYKIAFAGDNLDEPTDEDSNVDLPTVDLDAQIKEKEYDREVKREFLGEAKPKKSSKTVVEPMPERHGLNLGKNLLSGGMDIGSELKGAFIDKREPQPEPTEVKEVKPVKTIAKPVSAQTAVKRQRSIAIVDESKVGVGDSPIKGMGAGALLDDTFGEQKANLGDLTKPNASTPKRKPKAKVEPKEEDVKPVETPETKVEAPAEAPVEAVKEPETPAKPKIRKSSGPIDPWSLSATTLNQKYDVASGKVRTFEAVDENKVKVGDAPVKNKDAGDLLDDTFGEQRANLGIAEKKEEAPQEPKAEKPKAERKPRAKKPAEKTEEKPAEVTETPVDKGETTASEGAEKAESAEPKPEPKPRKKREPKPKVDTEAKPETKAENEEKTEEKPAPQKPKKKAEPKDPWGLSATTLNQKYDVPSGKVRNFAPVDENKVGVGKAPIRMATANELLSTFGEQNTKPVIIHRDEDDKE